MIHHCGYGPGPETRYPSPCAAISGGANENLQTLKSALPRVIIHSLGHSAKRATFHDDKGCFDSIFCTMGECLMHDVAISIEGPEEERGRFER